jgi:urease
MGDANASIPTIQPVYGLPMWGSEPLAAARSSIAFVSKYSIDHQIVTKYGLNKRLEPVRGCRLVRKTHMKWNDKKPEMKVHPTKYVVHADGEHMTVPAAEKTPLGRAYNLF